jgi:hypothetical protein
MGEIIMRIINLTAVAAVLALPIIALSVPASAATAHNSQAGAFGTSSNDGDTTVGSRHLKHAAKHASITTPADADRDAGMYVVKPVREPEYFGHASGSDGSMPQE